MHCWAILVRMLRTSAKPFSKYLLTALKIFLGGNFDAIESMLAIVRRCTTSSDPLIENYYENWQTFALIMCRPTYFLMWT